MKFRFRRKPRSRRHPTAEQALAALREGSCMYAPTGSACSGAPSQVGLRTREDVNVVLACGAHYGRLRQFPLRELNLLERVLVEAFFRPPAPTPEPNELRLVSNGSNRGTCADRSPQAGRKPKFEPGGYG